MRTFGTIFRSIGLYDSNENAVLIPTNLWHKAEKQKSGDNLFEIGAKPVLFTPRDFVPANAEKRSAHLREGNAELIHEPLLGTFGVKAGVQSEYFDTLEEAEFLKAVADVPMHGNIDVPTSPEICRAAINKYNEQRKGLEEILLAEAITFTNDETMQQRVVRELWKKMSQ